MAPQGVGHQIDPTPEYLEFIAALRDYHAKRGTNFDPEPKVGHTPVDLLKLFKLIVDHGGYDKVSEEKLAWRNMVNLLELYSSNEASAAYSLKLAYYKNLAAYEITTIHKQEPPPPEILEHISAKGGGLLTRTLENFGHRAMRPSGAFDEQSAESTPTRDPRATDSTPLSGRASRGLREAPPQRVIFQPDTGTTRQTRHASGAHHGHGGNATPGHHGTPTHHMGFQHMTPQSHLTHGQPYHPYQPAHQAQNHARNASFVYNPPGSEVFSPTVQAYEPRGPVPIVLQPVEAPANNPGKYLQQQRLQRLEAAGISLSRFATRPPVPPGSEGPNIYIRCLGSLRSGVPAEEAFALSHLVKISFERGDKYKFESFPGLAEGLFEKALQVGSLFYHDVNWTVSYDQEGDDGEVGELDGVNGTPDILDRIANLTPKDPIDSIQTEDFSDQLVLVTEAALTIRNMVTLQENAYFVSEFPPCRDFLCIVLNLPNKESVVELKHCALDIAEQVTPFLTLEDEDPLYRTLLRQLDSADRGTILTALRAIGRISMNMAHMNRLGNVPPSVLQNVMNWLLLNDDELMDACLDFLYQYTAVASNVERLLRSVKTENLVSHLVRLLSHGAKRGHRELILQQERKLPPSEEVLPLPPDLLTRLVATDEPERCYTWLRCFFEEDPDASITQIAIWQAYQSSFLHPVQQSGRTMLGAAEFIRNVTHVYHSAGAQIQKEQTAQGEVQKFIIKGIRPRVRPISPEGREFFRCQWTKPSRPDQRCSIFFGSADKLYYHILTQHLGETSDDQGKVAHKELDTKCRWAGCHSAYTKMARRPLVEFMTHIKTHAVAAEKQTEPSQSSASSSAFASSQQQQQSSASAAGQQQGAQGGQNAQQQPPLQPGQKTPQQHQRHRSSITNSDLTPGGGQTPGGAGASGSSSHKRQRRSYVIPAKTVSVVYEETATMRDERNPNLPLQAAGIPLSAVLVLRNIARNANKATVLESDLVGFGTTTSGGGDVMDVDMNGTETTGGAANGTNGTNDTNGVHKSHDHHGPTVQDLGRGEPGGWNERLFRPMLPRLYEIMAENRALASYITSLFQLIGEEW